jgi:hypothetical protein
VKAPLRGNGKKLSRGDRKNAGRGVSSKAVLPPGSDPLLLESLELLAPSLGDDHPFGVEGGNSDFTLAGDGTSAFDAKLLCRVLHADIALARQFVLTFVKVATASESLSFSA